MEFDPYAPDVQRDPYPIYRCLRDESPAHFNATRRFWTLSRYADVREALHDPIRFSSVGCLTLEADTPAVRPVLVNMDPPEHTRLRSLVTKAFTPRRIADLEPRIREVASELVAGWLSSGHCDVVRDFSGPLPTIVIAELLGVPREDRESFRRWTDELVTSQHPETGDPGPGLTAAAELFAYFKAALERRRAEPGDDLLTALLAARIGGDPLPEEDLLGFCLLLLVAGNETTTNLISNSLVHLAHHPEARRALIEHPERIPGAIEELLRFDAPAQGVIRTLRADLELHGERLRAGQKVLLLIGAANRDERAFSEPDRLDVGRSPNHHLAFGLGPHFCLGAHLARLEAQVAFETLLPRLGDYELETETPERIYSVNLRGLKHLPLRFEARP